MKSRSNKAKLAEKIFHSKAEYHKEMAKLPIEEKIKILVELQKIGIAANEKMKNRKIWNI